MEPERYLADSKNESRTSGQRERRESVRLPSTVSRPPPLTPERWAKEPMKKKILIPVAITALVAGCASAPRGAELVDHPGQLTPIQQAYADRLSRIKIGMTLDQFKDRVPEAYVGGQNEETTAYELTRSAKYVTQDDIDRQNYWWGAGSPRAKTEKQVLWFYFYKDKLVKWGRPGDWPQNPDKIIEIRER